jgi:hypothetical protein
MPLHCRQRLPVKSPTPFLKFTVNITLCAGMGSSWLGCGHVSASRVKLATCCMPSALG